MPDNGYGSPDHIGKNQQSGLGKPSLHVMASVDSNLSVGIESEKVRFDLSISNLCAVHRLSSIFGNISGRCFFLHLDCTSLTDVNPFTHVYSFDLAFPPNTIQSLVNIYNNSSNLQCVVSYKKVERLWLNI